MKKEIGFTLIELIITVSILSIMLSIAAPAFQNIIMSSQLASSANTMLGALQYTRSEAIKNNSEIHLCPSDNNTECSGKANWEKNWIAINNEKSILKIWSNTEHITSNTPKISYRANGISKTEATFTTSTENCKTTQLYLIKVTKTSPPSLSKETCS